MALSDPVAPVVQPTSDRQLVLRARSGDGAAQEELVLRHRQAAYLLALQLLGNPDDALDATQDTLIRFLTTLHRFHADRPVRPWLFSIVRNRCRDMMRRQRVRRHEPLEGDDERWRPEVVDQRADPYRDAERAELKRQIWHALSALAPAHREILVLRDYQDLSYAEIAQVLGVPQGTVMSRLHRARRQLAQHLTSTLPGPPVTPAGEIDERTVRS